MTAPARLATFGAALAVLFAGGAAAGSALDPDRSAPEPGHGAAAGDGGGHVSGAGREPDPVRGLGVAAGGLRILVEDPELRPGRAETLRFRIVGEDGATVRDFDVEHERRMHLIVVRRDLRGFQHLHPAQGPDGAWIVRARIGEPGSYRVFADFTHAGEARTLASDLRVDGAAELGPLPAPATSATAGDGYGVRLDAGRARPGREAALGFSITKDGAPVRAEPYLGAGGHLVALREGDLAFLHVHPTGHDATVRFAAAFPTAGRYRLFLQFKHAGRVRTAAFTQEVAR